MLKIGMVVERALTFLLVIGIVTHVFACLWYFLAKWNDFSPDTWVVQENYQDEDNFTKYIFCFYFIIQVLTTVGYGDMTIVSSGEKVLAIIIMMVGVITFSFAFGSLMSVLANLNSRAAKLKAKAFELNSIKRKYKIPEGLYKRLYKSIRYELEQEESITGFVETLPVTMRTDLLFTVNNQIISGIPYFTGKDKTFCATAAKFLTTTKVYRGDYIYQAKDPITEISFLFNGEAGFVVSEDKVTVVYSKIKKGNLFGELDYFIRDSEIPIGYRQFNVKALIDCEIISLTKEAVYELEKGYPEYIEEIFEFGIYRVDKLCSERDKAIQKLSRFHLANKNTDISKIKDIIKGKYILL